MNKKLIVAVIFAIVATATGLRHPAKESSHSQEAGSSHASQSASNAPSPRVTNAADDNRSGSANNRDISVLTQQQRVADYLHQHQRLPDYYLRKSEARKLGWDPSRGNLCDALPGRAIGGDRFSNREKVLPESQGRRWFEADVNYQCGRRGSDRMLYSSDGMIYVTRDHYRHVEKVY
ncbi:ribonuclease domain-containing protein [Pantoea sp. BAV 3049]|uniref:ribonuclease domain-containing protein n=1 Tax=Pantoea sp. BAV 3049 TaxID=2654188 RepID=UPI00131ECDA9|nr:ribonuclease domain-containing protein [Pantoea sp. BAV 3049]